MCKVCAIKTTIGTEKLIHVRSPGYMNSLTLRFRSCEGDISLAVSWEHFKLINENMIVCIPNTIVLLGFSPEVEKLSDSMITDLTELYDRVGEKTYRLKTVQDLNHYVNQYNKHQSVAAKLYFCYTLNVYSKKRTFEQYKDFI